MFLIANRGWQAYMNSMQSREILKFPDARLRTKARPVGEVTDATLELVEDLLETMYDAPGIGLAATQVGVPKRVLVMDVASEDEDPDPVVLIDPAITWKSEETEAREEGCLSVPEQYFEVVRPAKVKVEFTDPYGSRETREFEGLGSACVQHEIDHLDGILFIDRLSPVKKRMVKRKLEKEFAKKSGK